ncbi:diuretic hormone 45 isoform X2 [Hyposmocoma kahamanoa]|uniref:diuretic hormone 45 isoform X2 n=1 Tax=Hyposmocoma kahamanoa TaxID=1477025 RepID=UPI000E6D9C61|nr:diuretic hormone 45 isoform X2 [Hyposmocoma kahamanoa]
MMWWAVWCVAMVAGSTGAVPAPFYDGALIDPVIYHWGNIWTPDDSTQLTDHSVDAWPSSNGVSGVNVPRYETLSELREEHTRPKRKMPSLSINNPMEVLRQRLMLEVARKQMREANQRQALRNRDFLKSVGKRRSALSTS